MASVLQHTAVALLLLLPLAASGTNNHSERATPSAFDLHLLPQSRADQFGAKLLDGSVPGFYWRPGKQKQAWRIHLRGGGWCFTLQSCAARIGTELGSSSVWPQSIYNSTNSPFGFMNENTATNPYGDANLVFVPYGDGTSWTGSREEPMLYGPNRQQVWFRGRRNLDAVLHELDLLGGLLSNATDVIFTGTSAGGLAVYLHSAYVKSLLPPSANFTALPDAGWFLDAPQYGSGTFAFRADFQGAVGPSLWNATIDGTNAACLADKDPSELWQCFFAQYVMPYNVLAGIPFFVMQSLYDSAQLSIVANLGCNPTVSGSCSAAQLSAFFGYRYTLEASVNASLASSAQNGAFLTGCYQHEESCADVDWFGITFNGTTANATHYAWRDGGASAAASRRSDVAFPGDATCAPQGTRHGSC